MTQGRVRRTSGLLLVVVVLLAFCLPGAWAKEPAGVAGGTGEDARGAIRGGLRKGAEFRPGEIIVKFRDGGLKEKAARLRGRLGASVERLPFTDFDLLKVPAERMGPALEALRSSGLVEYAEPNYIRRVAWEPGDEDYPEQWNLKQGFPGGGINMPAAWDHAGGGSYPGNGGDPSVVVAVLDSGIAYKDVSPTWRRAPDMSGTRFTEGYDFINGDGEPYDDYGHGTHVAGTIAATTHEAAGEACAGIAFNCTLMPVKVLDGSGAGSDVEIIQGIRFAADKGADVINMSLSGPDPNEALRDAIDYAFGKETVVCSAAGNSGSSFVDYPAAYPGSIAVGATTRGKERASYSNYGSALDVMAPGGSADTKTLGISQQTFSSDRDPASGFKVRPKKGTSMASPHVAGVCALVKSAHPAWTAGQVRSAVSLGCVDLGAPGWDPRTGWGLIDAYAAVAASTPGATPPSVSAVSPDHGTAGQSATLTMTGSRFTNPVKVVLERVGEPGISGTGVTVEGETRARATVSLADAQPGLWDLVVEDKGMLSDTVRGGFAVDPADNRTWYLAEGSTDYGFEEFVLVQNPGAVEANVQVVFMTARGPTGPYALTVPAWSRATVKVNDVVPNQDVSTRVTSDRDIICERAMYWNGRVEGTDSVGVQAPAYAWYFSEGATDYGFETFLLVQNPSGRPANVLVTYLTPGGPVEREPFVVDANSRYSVNVGDDLPADEMSIQVVADERVICERSMYWDGRRGGHDSIGTNSPARRWYLAEGSTDWGFTEYVLLGNPGGRAAKVNLTWMTPGGPFEQPAVTVPAGSRVTVRANDVIPGEDVSVRVTSDRGIVAERAMYWDDGTGKAGHCALGVVQPRQECFLAEGSTNWGFEEWVLIQNPNPTACDVGVEYMTTHGLVPTTGFSMPANSRVSICVNRQVPYTDTSTRVYSNLPVIAERAMYWRGRGAGHVSPGLMK